VAGGLSAGERVEKLTASFLASICLLMAVAPYARSGCGDVPFAQEHITFLSLPNGLRVVTEEMPGTVLASVHVVIRVASRNEDSRNNGISHLLEHLIFRDRRLREAVEGVGGELNGFVTRDYTSFYATVSVGHLPSVLEALAQAIRKPTFDQAQVELERKVVLSELAGDADDPREIAQGLLMRMTHANHPYRLPIGGNAETLSAFTSERLQSWHSQWYCPDNSSVVISGGMSSPAVAEAVTRALGDWERGRVNREEVSPEPAQTATRSARAVVSSSPALLSLGWRGPRGEQARESLAMDLISQLLNGGADSRLEYALVEREGLAQSVAGEWQPLRDGGVLEVRALCAPEDLAEAKRAILRKVAWLRNRRVPNDELLHAKRLLAAGWIMGNESPDERARTLAEREGTSSYRVLTEWAALLRRITAADVQTVAKRYLDDRYAVIVEVGPKRDARSANR